MKYLLGNS